MIWPPRDPPNSFRLNGGLGRPVAKKFFDDSAALRLNANRLPCSVLVPSRVATITWAPPRPNSAEAPFEITRNSPTASSEGVKGDRRSLPVSMFDTPSTVILVDPNHTPPEMIGF